MSLLTTLHLSGNDISGTLPDIPGNNSVIQLVIRESSTKPSENFGVDGSYEN
eukprot:gene17295-22832_t